jgi:predicted PurR-regulated permease PerM
MADFQHSRRLVLNRNIATASYVLAGLALLLMLVFNLLPALFSALLVFAAINSLAPGLQRHLPGDRAYWFMVAVLATVVVGLLTFAIAAGVAYMGSAQGNPSALLEQAIALIERARAQLPAAVVAYLPDGEEAIRAAIIDWLREHGAQLQIVGKNAGRVLAQLLIGIVLGAMLALHGTRASSRRGPLAVALVARSANLAMAFRNIVFAQAKISAINTLLTGIYLLVVLPLFGVEVPLAKTLVVVTFVAGLLPVVGNLISNTMIFVAGLSVSVGVGVAALTYLVVIHKLEYFLNAGIIGGQIRARPWELLIAMLFMEAIFGIGGLIAAPIYYAALKRELESAGLI